MEVLKRQLKIWPPKRRIPCLHGGSILPTIEDHLPPNPRFYERSRADMKKAARRDCKKRHFVACLRVSFACRRTSYLACRRTGSTLHVGGQVWYFSKSVSAGRHATSARPFGTFFQILYSSNSIDGFYNFGALRRMLAGLLCRHVNSLSTSCSKNLGQTDFSTSAR